MEDEEYYHMMVEDMERLVRVHHHVEPPDPARRQERLHSPWVSGLRLALNDAIKAGLERLNWAAMWKESPVAS